MSERDSRTIGQPGIDAQAVRTFSEFAHLAESEIDDLRATLQPIVFPQGSTLVRQGDRDASIYLLVKGTVEVHAMLPEPGEQADADQIVTTLDASTVLGELGLLLDVPRTATIVARTDAVCWQITRENFYAAVERGEVWAARLALAVATELARRFVHARAEVIRQASELDPEAPVPEHKVAELARLRARLLAEWTF